MNIISNKFWKQITTTQIDVPRRNGTENNRAERKDNFKDKILNDETSFGIKTFGIKH